MIFHMCFEYQEENPLLHIDLWVLPISEKQYILVNSFVSRNSFSIRGYKRRWSTCFEKVFWFGSLNFIACIIMKAFAVVGGQSNVGALQFIIFLRNVDEVWNRFGEGKAFPIVAIFSEIRFESLHFKGVSPAAALSFDFIKVIMFEVDVG